MPLPVFLPSPLTASRKRSLAVGVRNAFENHSRNASAETLTALRGSAAYGLSWFDAHPWAHAEIHGIAKIFTEDFEHGRHYGTVRTVDPFLAAAGGVHELPALYGESVRRGSRA